MSKKRTNPDAAFDAQSPPEEQELDLLQEGQEDGAEAQPPGEETPGQGETEGEEKPQQLIAGKFKSPEELERSYLELEAKATRDSQTIREYEQIISRMGPPPGHSSGYPLGPPPQGQSSGFFDDPHAAVERTSTEVFRRERQRERDNEDMLKMQRLYNQDPAEYERRRPYFTQVPQKFGPSSDPQFIYEKAGELMQASREEEISAIEKRLLDKLGISEESARQRILEEQKARKGVTGAGGGPPPKKPEPKDEGEQITDEIVDFRHRSTW